MNAPDEDNPYADWEPPNTCHCCDTKYCQSMADEALGDQYYDEYTEREKAEKLWQEARITKFHADMAQSRAGIVQAEADIARITAHIAKAKSEIAKANCYIDTTESEEEYYYARDLLSNAEVNLTNAETSLADAVVVLSNARAIGAVHNAVIIAVKNVENAEARVQAKKDAKDLAIEIKETSGREYDVEESNLLDEGAHVEYVNALIDLAEAKDALDLAEIILTKTPSPLIHGYGFASHESRCPTSYITE